MNKKWNVIACRGKDFQMRFIKFRHASLPSLKVTGLPDMALLLQRWRHLMKVAYK